MFKKMFIVSLLLIAVISIPVLAADVLGGTVVTESAVNLRKGPSTSDDVVDKLYDGTRVAVLDKSAEWYKVAIDGVTGFIHQDYVETQEIMNIVPGGAKVTTSVLNMREKPTTDSTVVSKLSEGTTHKIIGINTGWFKIELSNGTTGYVHPDYVEVVPFVSTSSSGTSAKGSSSNTVSSKGGNAVINVENLSQTRKDILEYAATLLGIRYKYGGASPSTGFDCSGYTSYVFAHFDIKLARSSADQYSSSVTKINKADLQPGDLVFFSRSKKGTVGHVGIYVGNNTFIHSPSPGGVVEYESMDSSYYSSRYIGAGTVLK